MNLSDQIKQAIADTLNLPLERIGDTTSTEDLVEWDSLGQINLMMAIEQTFDLMLDVEDFQNLNSVPAILEYLDAQGVTA